MLRASELWHLYNRSHKVFNYFACGLLGTITGNFFMQAYKVATIPEEDLPAVRLRRSSYTREFSSMLRYQQMSQEERNQFVDENIRREKEEEE